MSFFRLTKKNTITYNTNCETSCQKNGVGSKVSAELQVLLTNPKFKKEN